MISHMMLNIIGTDLDGRCIAIQEAKQKRPDYPKDNYRNNNNSSRYGRDRRDYSRDRRDSSRDRRDYGRDRRDSYRFSNNNIISSNTFM